MVNLRFCGVAGINLGVVLHDLVFILVPILEIEPVNRTVTLGCYATMYAMIGSHRTSTCSTVFNALNVCTTQIAIFVRVDVRTT
ncbi:hypothetical protein CAZ10_11330 [Pseudomonas aeruginosa]|uniref:Uncharacterized protein n=1 Tax=Pseudomonas aeruginosa TaxID=287 RepID=A0A241XSC1_PSEAI|nr:hypothetical protein CAZ10_11330 [Pseudomonas aeruginosa]